MHLQVGPYCEFPNLLSQSLNVIADLHGFAVVPVEGSLVRKKRARQGMGWHNTADIQTWHGIYQKLTTKKLSPHVKSVSASRRERWGATVRERWGAAVPERWGT